MFISAYWSVGCCEEEGIGIEIYGMLKRNWHADIFDAVDEEKHAYFFSWMLCVKQIMRIILLDVVGKKEWAGFSVRCCTENAIGMLFC